MLRDVHGIPLVQPITQSKTLCILKSKGFTPKIPEDLYHLIKEGISIRKHLERNTKDKDSRYPLVVTEAHIHRLARYYKFAGQIPLIWK